MGEFRWGVSWVAAAENAACPDYSEEDYGIVNLNGMLVSKPLARDNLWQEDLVSTRSGTFIIVSSWKLTP
jgi:hypothetical protein